MIKSLFFIFISIIIFVSCSHEFDDLGEFWENGELFWANVIDSSGRAAENYQVPAVRFYSGKYCDVYVETKNVHKADRSTAENFGIQFDLHFPTLISNVYTPSDINNDKKVTILLLDIQDGYDGSGSFIGGYFYAINQFLDDDVWNTYGLRSNERELIYIDIDPMFSLGIQQAYSVMIHEFTHLLVFSRNAYDETDGGMEDTWIEEGLTESASHLVYGSLSLRLEYYCTDEKLAIRSGLSLIDWGSEDVLANYASSYMFIRYMIGRYGSELLIRDIITNQKEGYAGLDSLTQVNFAMTLGEFYRDWMIANYFGGAFGPAQYRYTDINLVEYGGVRLLPTGTISVTLPSFSGVYFYYVSGDIDIPSSPDPDIKYVALFENGGVDLNPSGTIDSNNWALLVYNSSSNISHGISSGVLPPAHNIIDIDEKKTISRSLLPSTASYPVSIKRPDIKEILKKLKPGKNKSLK